MGRSEGVDKRFDGQQRFSRGGKRVLPSTLPHGRHGLPRSFVIANQHQRIISAVAAAASMSGYHALTVEDIAAQAQISKRTFYDHFADKGDALLAAYDEAINQLTTGISRATAGAGSFAQRCESAVRALIDYVEAEPAFAVLCLVEAPAAGQQGMERRMAAVRRAATALLEAAGADLPGGPLPTETMALATVGGLAEVVYCRLITARIGELRELIPELTYALLLPFCGQDAAGDYRRMLAAPA